MPFIHSHNVAIWTVDVVGFSLGQSLSPSIHYMWPTTKPLSDIVRAGSPSVKKCKVCWMLKRLFCIEFISASHFQCIPFLFIVQRNGNDVHFLYSNQMFQATSWLVWWHCPFTCPNLNKDIQNVLLQRQFTSACSMEESILNPKVVSHHQWGGGKDELQCCMSQVNVLWRGATARKVISWPDIANWAKRAVLKESCTVADITVTQIFWESGLRLFHELLITGSSWREENLSQDFFFFTKRNYENGRSAK